MPSAHVICCSFESEQLAGGGSGAEYAGGAGDVPAHVVMLGKDGQPDAALRFDPQHECVHKFCAAQVPPLGEREYGGQHRRARMDRARVRVVEVEHVRC